MIKRTMKLVMLFMFSLSLIACSGEPKKTVTDRLSALNFTDSEKLLLRSVDELNDWILKKQSRYDSTHSYIFQNVLFENLYKNSYEHFPYTKSLLKNPEVDISIKKLLVRTSLCLKLHDYLMLGHLIFDHGNKELMTVFISPGPEYGNILSENYSDPLVVKFLDVVVKKYPSAKGTAEFIMSGSYFKQTNEYREFGEQLPVLSCFAESK